MGRVLGSDTLGYVVQSKHIATTIFMLPQGFGGGHHHDFSTLRAALSGAL